MLMQPRDLLIFEVLQRHGPLPSHYLYAFTEHLAKDRFGFAKRLLALTREGYLARPPQLNHPLLFTDFKVYALTVKAREILRQHGKLDRFALPMSGDFKHQLMTACITANIALGAVSGGYRYVSQEEILASRTCPEETRAAQKPLAVQTSITHTVGHRDRSSHVEKSNRFMEPDQLFGIDYGNGYRFYALETDRGTEPLIRQNLRENSILKKLLSYKDILACATYKTRWGLPNLFPLFITTSEKRVENMLALARSLHQSHSSFLLFGFVPGFKPYVRTPELLPHLFSRPYSRISDNFDIGRP